MTLKNIASTLLLIILLDLFVVLLGMSQIAIEGRTAYWNPFWAGQAKTIITLLGK